MAKVLKSNTVTSGRRMAGARSLWRANGMKTEHFGKPVIAIANSFTQFVPGHAHLHKTGQYVKQLIESKGYFAAEFNTIAIDDGIAMGHSGMLYSLPSREIIADSIEYMCNAHCADALFCITNCDKITPGMLMAAMRLNIPTVFVSGGPMEAGNFNGRKIDLVDAMVLGGNQTVTDEELADAEKSACPTCGSCSGMFTANSMNCLTEALGLALPGNGTVVATHQNRLKLFEKAVDVLLSVTNDYYNKGDETRLPLNIATKPAFLNSMMLDIAMGGSTNTVLHLLAIAGEAGVDFTMTDIDLLSRKVPCLCKVAPNSSYHIEDVNRAGGVMAILTELNTAGLLNTDVARVDAKSLKEILEKYDITKPNASTDALTIYQSAPAGKNILEMAAQNVNYEQYDLDRVAGCVRNVENAYYADGGLAVLKGNLAQDGCIVKTAGVDAALFRFTGKAIVFESQEDAVEGILNGTVQEGHVVVIKFEGPAGGPGMQEMLYPTSYLKSRNLDKKCALITDGRFSGGTSGLSVGHVSPEAAAGGVIGLVKNNDIIEIDIKERTVKLCVAGEELENRKQQELLRGKEAFTPVFRKRHVPKSLQYYAQFVSSADKGAVRELKNH